MSNNDNKQQRGPLQPTMPIDSTPLNPDHEKLIIKLLSKAVGKHEREKVLIRALAKKGVTGEEITNMLRGADAETDEDFQRFK